MQKPELAISKNTFYIDGRAFAETTPPSECQEHSVCGCTRYVAQKPEEAEISQIKFSLSLNSGEDSNAFHKGAMSVSVSLGTFFFDGAKIEKYANENYLRYFIRPQEKHVYLYVYKNKLGCEYYIPGYGLVDYMFPRIYRGNEIDRSRLFNGHSPPKIDTTVHDSRQLWSYGCSWGKEGFKLISDDTLQRVIDIGNEILEIVASIQVSPDSKTEDIYKSVKESGFEENSSQIERFLREFDLPSHQIFDTLHSIECATHDVQSMFKEQS